MKKNNIIALFLAFISLPGFSFEVDLLEKGKFSCDNDISYDSKGEIISCEASGVVCHSGMIYFVTDWWKNSKPNFFFYKSNGHSNISKIAKEIEQETINSTKKIEDLTLSQNGEYVFATSSFFFGPLWDAVWKPMNRILYWPTTNPSLVRILDFEDTPNEELMRSKILDSVRVRYPDTDFIKIESLAVLPNNRLLMAVRERGTKYDQFEYQSILISISYEVAKNGNLHLVGEFEVIAEMDLSHPLLEGTYSLSSFEYDFDYHVLYALATYERGDPSNPFSTALWCLYSNDNFVSEQGYTAELAKDCSGSPLLLPHKLEGISKIKGLRYIAVADDDRIFTTSDGTRKPYEAFYYIFNLNLRSSASRVSLKIDRFWYILRTHKIRT